MRIVNIMQGTNLGGMEQASLRLMIGLKARGHECEVVSLNTVGALGHLLQKHGISTKGIEYRGKGGWRSILQLLGFLQETSADALVMTGHNLLAMLALGKLCQGRRVLAIHFHHEGVKPLWQWRLIYRVACKRFQAITFPSEFIRSEAEKIYPPLKRIAHTVRNPFQMPQLPSVQDRKGARASLGLPENVPVVGNAGWLIPRKRFDIFLQVAARVVREFPDTIFAIAGDGPERNRLELLSAELRISDRIRWLGWQQDMMPFYLSLDVMLFNSDFDAMGLSPLEAVSYGVPLVSSVLHGGLKEVVTGDEFGVLLNSHNLKELAEKVCCVLRDKEAAYSKSLACRKRIAEMSGMELIASEMELLLSGASGEAR